MKLKSKILNIDKSNLNNSDPVSHYRLVLLKTLTLFFLIEFPVIYLVMKARGFPLGEVITNFILVTYIPSFLLIHIFVKNSSNYKFGAATLFSSLTLLVLSVPYIQPIGMGSPFFQHLPVLLVLCYVLLDIKVTIYLSGIIIVYLVLQYTGLEQYLGIKIAGELDPITTDRYRTRFTSTIITLAIIFVLHKISYAIRSALAEEKIKAASVERYETLGKVAAGFAHEINNPLAIASGHANQLREFKEVKKFQDKIDKIEVAHQRISSIVSNFLAIFSIKDTLIRPTVLNLCFSRLNHEILSKIKISVPKDATVNSNFEHLVQVLKFITENALEAAKGSNPPVEWVIFDDYSIACIDYGDGFETKFEEAIRPFVTSHRNVPGRGLGLFEANILCEQMHAELFHIRREFTTLVGVRFKERITLGPSK